MSDGRRRRRPRFGQHFLEPAWTAKVLAAIQPKPDEVFIEIGPGRGALTIPLAASARGVVAFEIDRDLAARLRTTGPANVHIVETDFLTVTDGRLRAELAAAGFGDAPCPRVAGNLPYGVAAPILLRLIQLSESGRMLGDATVMLQREVADRLLASPGTRDYGVLSILVRHRADVGRLLNLPPGAFRPVPKVESSLVRLVFRSASPPVARPDVVEALAKALFSRRRKTLANALQAYRATSPTPAKALAMVGLDPRRRPETLELEELGRLADAYVVLGARSFRR